MKTLKQMIAFGITLGAFSTAFAGSGKCRLEVKALLANGGQSPLLATFYGHTNPNDCYTMGVSYSQKQCQSALSIYGSNLVETVVKHVFVPDNGSGKIKDMSISKPNSGAGCQDVYGYSFDPNIWRGY